MKQIFDKKTKYYKLNDSGTKWELINNAYIETGFIKLENYKQIKLYKDNLEFMGIGLY